MIGMRMGMGLGAMQNSGGGATPAVWTIASDADGTKYVRIQCATTGQTLTAAGGAEIKLESGGEWGTSAVIPAGNTNRNIYFRGNGTGGTLTFPNPENITYLYLYNTGTSITGSITGMELTYLYLYSTGEYITGVPPALGKTLQTFRILGGTSYDYPWTEQTWDATTKRTWTATTMSIDCVAAAPTPEQFNTWLGGTTGTNGLADVSNSVTPGTVMLTLKNTPTEAAMTAEGVGPTDVGSGMYRMLALGYTLVLGE